MAAGLIVFLRARLSGSFAPRIVAQAGEIPVGGSKIFTYPTNAEPCILLRPAPDSYIAYSRLCTHASCPVFYNSVAHRFDCPCHGGSFSIADGSVLQGPPPRPLPKIVLERRGSDIVAVGMTTKLVSLEDRGQFSGNRAWISNGYASGGFHKNR